jgi:hypothetical protein
MIFAFMRNKGLAILMSVLLGFALSALFRPACKDKTCVVYKAPAVGSIHGKVFQYGHACFEFAARPVQCPAPKLSPQEGGIAGAAEDAPVYAGLGTVVGPQTPVPA